MDQVSIKYTHIFYCKTPQIYPNLDFWFENKPSGNPVGDCLLWQVTENFIST
jgi:hypothetical protein